jgi:hypothetical protein
MKLNFAAKALAGVVLAAGLASAASATNYTYTWDGKTSGVGGFGTNSTKLTALTTNFNAINPAAQLLSFSASYGSEFIKDDGFWLVLTAGGNPKGIANEFAILYGDVKTGTITAYKYNGANSPLSWQDPNAYIASYKNAITSSGSTYGFSLDVTSLNALAFGTQQNIGFANEMGIWYHSIATLSATYNGNRLTSFSGPEIYFDADTLCTNGLKYNPTTKKCGGQTGGSGGTPVPEPMTVALLGFGLAGVGMATRRRRA